MNHWSPVLGVLLGLIWSVAWTVLVLDVPRVLGLRDLVWSLGLELVRLWIAVGLMVSVGGLQ